VRKRHDYERCCPRIRAGHGDDLAGYVSNAKNKIGHHTANYKPVFALSGYYSGRYCVRLAAGLARLVVIEARPRDIHFST
jgi:hypothetical protein